MNKKYIILLTALPTILVLTSGLSLLLYVRDKGSDATPRESEVTRDGVQKTLDKLYNYIGKREMKSSAKFDNIRSVTAMVDGSLGPENLGYEVYHSEGEVSEGFIWPMLWIDLGAKKAGKVKVLAIAQQDEGAALALGMHFAEYVAGHWDGGHVKIVFYSPLMAGPNKEKIWKTLGVPETERGGFYALISGSAVDEPSEVTTEQVQVELVTDPASAEQAEIIMDMLPKLENLLK